MELLRLVIHNFTWLKDVNLTLDSSIGPSSVVGVVGENLDSDGATSNGAGKSMLFEAVVWALCGRTVREQTAAGVIGPADSSCSVVLYFTTKDGKSLSVGRVRGPTGIAVNVFLNGMEEHLNATDGQRRLNAFFGFNPRHPFVDLVNRMFFSSEAADSFASASATDKDYFEVVEKFLRLQVLEEARKLAAANRLQIARDLKSLTDQVALVRGFLNGVASTDDIDAQILACTNTRNSVLDQLTSVKSQENVVKTTKDFLINKLMVTSRSWDQLLGSHKRETTTFTAQIEEAEVLLQSSSAESVGGDTTALEEEERTLLRAIDSTELERVKVLEPWGPKITQADRVVAEIKRQLALLAPTESPLACPSCHVGLLFQSGKLVLCTANVVEQERASLQEDMKIAVQRYQTMVEERDSSTAFFTIRLTDIRNRLRLTTDSIRLNAERAGRIKTAEGTVKSLKGRLAEVQTKFSEDMGILAERLTLEKREFSVLAAEVQKSFGVDLGLLLDDVTQDLRIVVDLNLEKRFAVLQEDCQRKLQGLQKNLGQAESGIRSLTDVRQEIVKSLAKLSALEKQLVTTGEDHQRADFWAKEFPVLSIKVIGRFLPLFEGMTNRFLEMFHVEHRIRCRMSESVKTQRTFGIEVFDGTSYRGVRTFSQGERARIAVAAGLAMREISRQGFHADGLDFLVVDELLDRIDEAGVEAFFSVVENVPGVKFVVSHRTGGDFEKHFDRTLLVRRENGVADACLQTK